MKILYSITYYLPHLSGLTRCLQPIAEGLAAGGHHVDVLTGKHAEGLADQEVIRGVMVTRAPVLVKFGKGLIMPLLWMEAWRKRKSLDLLHLILPHFDAAPLALTARIAGRPVVLTYVCSYSGRGIKAKLATFVLAMSHAVAGFCAQRIIVVSEDYAQQSRFCRLFRRKLVFIPLPVPFYPDRALPSRSPGEAYRIGFVGRISVEKNVLLLVEAIPLLRKLLQKPFTLEFVGPKDPPIAKGAHELSERLENCSYPELKLLGALSEVELDRFYGGIDVLVLPSADRIEAYGLVQVEAMLRGTPCVTSDRPGMRLPVQVSGFGALFDPSSRDDLAVKIKATLARDLSKDPAPEAIHTIFHPKKIVDAIADAYASLL